MTPDDLVAVEEIKRLKYRYLRGLDQKLWDVVGACFTEDAVASYSGGKYHYEGRDAILAFLEGAMGAESFHSSHRCHHPEIDLDGPDRASGVWALDDVVVETQWNITIRGAAFYVDDYVRTGAGWRIARTGYKRTYEEIQPRGDQPGLELTASWWATGGQSRLDA